MRSRDDWWTDEDGVTSRDEPDDDLLDDDGFDDDGFEAEDSGDEVRVTERDVDATAEEESWERFFRDGERDESGRYGWSRFEGERDWRRTRRRRRRGDQREL